METTKRFKTVCGDHGIDCCDCASRPYSGFAPSSVSTDGDLANAAAEMARLDAIELVIPARRVAR